jgi:putative transposase
VTRKIRHRRSIRLPHYDYTQPGAYFVTVCTKDREHLFGKIVNGTMLLNRIGDIVQQIWEELPGRFPNIALDLFIVMPNHFHGIIIISNAVNDNTVGAGFPRPKHTDPNPGNVPTLGAGTGGAAIGGAGTAPLQGYKPSLGQMVAFFKYGSAKHINEYRKTPAAAVWQRNYYEHIIRSESKLNQMRQYILDNPAYWNLDENNPANLI